ncbi:hypothetical protein TNCV_2541021 [Trichonephila clavipes]|nr:hypothetical protein TNCV_2541021 [Trichonephila clavipes]
MDLLRPQLLITERTIGYTIFILQNMVFVKEEVNKTVPSSIKTNCLYTVLVRAGSLLHLELHSEFRLASVESNHWVSNGHQLSA